MFNFLILYVRFLQPLNYLNIFPTGNNLACSSDQDRTALMKYTPELHCFMAVTESTEKQCIRSDLTIKLIIY